jgi:hypothetical protein
MSNRQSSGPYNQGKGGGRPGQPIGKAGGLQTGKGGAFGNLGSGNLGSNLGTGLGGNFGGPRGGPGGGLGITRTTSGGIAAGSSRQIQRPPSSGLGGTVGKASSSSSAVGGDAGDNRGTSAISSKTSSIQAVSHTNKPDSTSANINKSITHHTKTTTQRSAINTTQPKATTQQRNAGTTQRNTTAQRNTTTQRSNLSLLINDMGL